MIQGLEWSQELASNHDSLNKKIRPVVFGESKISGQSPVARKQLPRRFRFGVFLGESLKISFVSFPMFGATPLKSNRTPRDNNGNQIAICSADRTRKKKKGGRIQRLYSPANSEIEEGQQFSFLGSYAGLSGTRHHSACRVSRASIAVVVEA
jgi:hypothetical protein